MGVTVVTPATTRALTSVGAITAELPAATADAAGTALVVSLIGQASDAIATYTHRTWGRETVQELLPGTGRRYLGLRCVPLVTVGTVLQDADAVTDYSIEDADAGSLYRANGWPGGCGGGWDSVAYSSGYILSAYAATLRYTATYIAGYVLPGTAGTATSTLPGDVERAAIETVKSWWQQRASHDPSVTRKQAGDVSLSYGSLSSTAQGGLPPIATQLLRNWVRPEFRY